MSFAGQDQIYVSRSYFEFVSNLSEEYKALFSYRGAQQDKHGREHQLYELIGVGVPLQMLERVAELAAFDLDKLDMVMPQAVSMEMPVTHPPADVAAQLLRDAIEITDTDVQPLVKPEAVSLESEKSLAVAALKSVEAQPYSDEEARELADAQAKKWLEAEQRATEQTREKQEIQSAPVKAAVMASDKKLATRAHRKPLPWRRIAAGLFVLLLAALFVVPAVLPMQGYLVKIEQMMSARLQQPVHIAHMSGRILPTPRLVFDEVSIGGGQSFKAGRVEANFAFSALWGQVKRIDHLLIEHADVSGAALPQAANWLQKLADDPDYPVANIVLQQGNLSADGLAFTDVGGEFYFDASGKFSGAHLAADSHKLVLEIQASQAISLTLRNRAFPLLPGWVFDDLKVTGELAQDELRINSFDGRIAGGVLTGSARINWRSGWRVQGALDAKVISLQNINKLLVGNLDGSARFQMQAASLDKLADSALLNGVFTVGKGSLSGVDVVETTRLHSRDSLPGGRTYFESLSGELYYSNGIYRFSPLRLSDSVVKASGRLTVSDQKLTGSLSSSLTMRAGMGSAELQIDGTTQSPSLRAVR